MANLENDGSNKQTTGNDAQEEANIYEDEINLMDYFLVLWKRKWFILLGSVLPAFIVGLILFFSPRNYKVTYVYDVKGQSAYDVKSQSAYDVKDQSAYDVKDQGGYDVGNWNLNQNNYKILLGRFYSAENTNKIKAKLQEYNLEAVNFEVWPSYIDLSKAKVKDLTQVEQIRQLKAQLLNMTITGRPKNDIPKIALVIRDNFENIMPAYTVKDQLNAATRRLRTQIAAIEENRANLEFALKTNKAILAKLKNIKTKTPDKSESNVALQFDISGKTEYLPVEYQIQAAESKTIQAGEELVTNEKKYNYYKDLLALNEKLFAELKGKMSSYYTIQQFHSFLTNVVKDYKDKELVDYLNSYIKKIENRISASAPVTENPKIYAVARGTVKKSAIVFAILLMISVFAAFLLEGIQKSQAQTS
jgi:hypothetical protein